MKKELYYIRGNKERAEEVKAALLEKYPEAKTGNVNLFDSEDLYYFCLKNTIVSTFIDGSYGEFVGEYGTELHLSTEKEESKIIKIGDVVVSKMDNTTIGCVISITNGFYFDIRFAKGFGKEYVSDLRLATPEEIDKWNKDELHRKHLHYSKTERKLRRWYLPYEPVLTRMDIDCEWQCDLFSHIMPANYTNHNKIPYACIGGNCAYCIPYNDKTAHLVGTTEDYKEEEL